MPKLRRVETDDGLPPRLTEVVRACAGIAWLAAAISRSEGAIRKWLNGSSQPNSTDLKLICEATGTSVQWLLFGTGPRLAADIPEAAQRIDERRFFSVLQSVVDQAEHLNVNLGPLELGQLVVDFYERPDPIEAVAVEDFRRKIQVMAASRPGGM